MDKMKKHNKIKVYSIFDDYSDEAADILHSSGVDLTIHPLGKPRPNYEEMKELFDLYDGVIIGTSQKMPIEMFENVDCPKIIATASVGIDHIVIPEEKKDMIKVINTPLANAQSVAEYVYACSLSSIKRIYEGKNLYEGGKNNKSLYMKPGDLYGKTIGVIGAGAISRKIMEYGKLLGLKVYYWTRNPKAHPEVENMGIKYLDLEQIVSLDIISVNLPNVDDTKNFISSKLVSEMNENAIFISVSRLDTIDIKSLLKKAKINKNFYLYVDIDVDTNVIELINQYELHNAHNVIITPHIAGGTIETRKRMFKETAEKIAEVVNGNDLFF